MEEEEVVAHLEPLVLFRRVPNINNLNALCAVTKRRKRRGTEEEEERRRRSGSDFITFST